MKLNKKIIKALTSAQLVIQALMLLALILIMTFYPAASWIHMTLGSIFMLAIQAVVIVAGFKNETSIAKTLGEVSDDDDEEGNA